MDDGSRWERWGRAPYPAIGVALLIAATGTRFAEFMGPGTRSVVNLVLVLAGTVLIGGPWMHRVRRRSDEEIARNPSGKPVPLDERLATVSHPRSRWTMIVVLAALFALATAWAIHRAATEQESALVGVAIYVFLPVPLFTWLAWHTRGLLHRRR